MLPLFQKGQSLTAAALNALVRAIERRTSVRAGHGIDVFRGDDGVVVSLAARADNSLIKCVITGRSAGNPTRAADVNYDVRGFQNDGVHLVNKPPDKGRPTTDANVMINPARIGALAYIHMEPQADGSIEPKLWIPAGGPDGETLVFARCEGGTPLAKMRITPEAKMRITPEAKKLQQQQTGGGVSVGGVDSPEGGGLA